MANQIDERVKPFEVKMGKSIASLDSEFGTIRAGRANPHVLDRITVDYYGTPTPLQQVANISAPICLQRYYHYFFAAILIVWYFKIPTYCYCTARKNVIILHRYCNRGKRKHTFIFTQVQFILYKDI